MNNHKATPEQWEEVGAFASATRDCILELRARVEALEAQANHFVDVPKMVPPTVATDEELRAIWDDESDFEQALHSTYNLGIEHGQAGSREVADPAPVAGALEIAFLVTELSRIAKDVSASGRFADASILARAASLINRLDVQLPKRDSDPAPVAGELVARVARAIHPDYCADFHLYLHEARAAILEQATWLSEQGAECSADLLEQEAGR